MKEIFSDDLGALRLKLLKGLWVKHDAYLKNKLLILRKGVSTDQLDNFVQFFFFLEEFFELSSQVSELTVEGIEVRFKLSILEVSWVGEVIVTCRSWSKRYPS